MAEDDLLLLVNLLKNCHERAATPEGAAVASGAAERSDNPRSATPRGSTASAAATAAAIIVVVGFLV